MDKREIAAAFRERLQLLLAEERGGIAGFLRDTRLDRSALSQFLDPAVDRMPRAETLRRIAEARGVTADWLLSLSNAPEGRQVVTPSVQIESAESSPEGGSPIDQWRREAAGMKLRYVPSNLPDMLRLEDDRGDSPASAGQPENVLGGYVLGDMDLEIAMPVQTLARPRPGLRPLARHPRRPAPPPARPHGGHLRRGLPHAAPPPLRRPRSASPPPSPSSAASAPRSTSARPTSSSPPPTRSPP